MISTPHWHQVLLACTSLFVATACAHGAARRTSPPPAASASVSTRIRALEAQPFAADAGSERDALLVWLTETPDVSVNLVPLLGSLDDLYGLYGEPIGDALYFHYALGMARFILEHPDRPQNAVETADSVDVQAAGIRASLAVYEQLRRARPELARHAVLERLLELRQAGALEAHLVRELSGYGMVG